MKINEFVEIMNQPKNKMLKSEQKHELLKKNFLS